MSGGINWSPDFKGRPKNPFDLAVKAVELELDEKKIRAEARAAVLSEVRDYIEELRMEEEDRIASEMGLDAHRVPRSRIDGICDLLALFAPGARFGEAKP